MPTQITVLAMVLLLSGFARAQTFTVLAYDCPGRGPSRTLSGFKIKKFDGILTALHGVLGCGTIKAVPDQGQPLSTLTLSMVDIKNDVALLTSPEFSNKFPGGFDEGRGTAVLPKATLRVQGHPLAIHQLSTDLTARDPSVVPLGNLLPAGDVSDNLEKRLSPSTSIQVISIQGTILPGHSGAPILDSRGYVVGVANGGLLGGAAQISWAIPIDNIHLINRDGNPILDQIAKLDAAELFDFDPGPTGGGPVSISQRIFAAVRSDDVDSLRRALQVVDVPQTDKDDALFEAAADGKKDLVSILVQAGARVKEDVLCSADSFPPEAIKILGNLQNADPNYRCEHGETPLLAVLRRTGAETEPLALALLSIPRVDVNARYDNGDSALHKAVFGRYSTVVERMVEMRGIDLNARNAGGQTPADMACFTGQNNILGTLLDHGAKGGIYSTKDLRDCYKRHSSP